MLESHHDRVDNYLRLLENCHKSYSGYYDTGCCEGAYCEQNSNCVTNCCWNNRCDPADDNCFGPGGGGGGANLTWLWIMLSCVLLCCIAVFLVVIIRRKRQSGEGMGSDSSVVVTSQ